MATPFARDINRALGTNEYYEILMALDDSSPRVTALESPLAGDIGDYAEWDWAQF